MKTPSLILLTLVLSGALLVPAARAADVAQDAYQASVAQESVRVRAQEIKEELATIVQELRLNGMSDDQIAEVLKTSNRLSNISQEEMQAIIDSLKSASATQEAKTQQSALVSAYQKQKDASLKLKTLASKFAAQKSVDLVTLKIQELILRQAKNLRKTQMLNAENKTPDKMDYQQKLVHQVAGAEQAAISKEIPFLAASLETTANSGAATPEDAERAKLTLARIDGAGGGSNLTTLSIKVADQTASGSLGEAADGQAQLKKGLFEVLLAWSFKEDLSARLQRVRNQVGQMMNGQSDLLADTKVSEKREEGSALADQQYKIEDRAELAGASLDVLNPEAFALLQKAQASMKQSSTQLEEERKPNKAAPAQEQVLAALTQIDELLKKQSDLLAAKMNENPVELMKDLQNLKAQVDQAKTEAEKNPTSALAQKTQNLQQEAAMVAPQAADNIQQASDALQQPQPDGQTASQQLAQASAALQQQMDQLAPVAAQYAALDKVDDMIAAAQQDATEAQQALTQANQTEALNNMLQAQQQAAQAAQQAAAPQAAQQALQQAAQALQQGAGQAAQNQQAQAQAQAQQGQAALGQAQAAVAQAKQELQQGQSQQGNGQFSDGPEELTADALQGSGDKATAGQVMGGLSPKDREALAQYESEKTPPEFSNQVQQYLKNLSDASGQ